MGRARTVLACLGLGVLLSAGCGSTQSSSWHWPWQKPSALAQEYSVPPEADSRFSEPPRFPKSVMAPGLQKRDSSVATGDRPPPGFGRHGQGMPGQGRF